MASTYSASLRLELMAAGDQVGTWGTTANTNLGTLIEGGIAGYSSVSVTAADQALTALNGSADQSRNAFIALTTITAANFNVYAPPAPKSYTLYNASAYTATIYNSTVIGNTTAAGTGIAVPAGKTVTVWSDGTNFSATITHLPTATTSLTPASGTNTTQLATTAFVATAIAEGVPPGVVWEFASATPPTGWLLADGTAVSRATYAALFAVIGTTFGAGDGATTFNVPNRTNRIAVGAGGLYALGATGGSKDAIAVTHTHTNGTLAVTVDGSHAHNVTDAGHTHSGQVGSGATGDVPGGGSTVVPTGNVAIGSATTGIAIQVDGSHTHALSGAVANAGASGTDANMPPYVAQYFIIKT